MVLSNFPFLHSRPVTLVRSPERHPDPYAEEVANKQSTKSSHKELFRRSLFVDIKLAPERWRNAVPLLRRGEYVVAAHGPDDAEERRD